MENLLDLTKEDIEKAIKLNQLITEKIQNEF